MLYLGAKKSLLSSGKSLAAQIAALFASGEQGAWYEPSLTNGTLYQDSAGTTPVTAVGQPVGRMLDKSGRGNHATQPTTVNRPILQIDGNGRHFLAFNGTNSWMSTAAINFTATDKMTMVAGHSMTNVTQIVCEISANGDSSAGTAYLAGVASLSRSSINATGAAGVSAVDSVTTIAKAVVATSFNGAMTTLAGKVRPRINGTVASSSMAIVGSLAAGNFGNYPLYIGSRAGSIFFLNGAIYGIIVRGALSSDAQISSAEAYMNSKTRAY